MIFHLSDWFPKPIIWAIIVKFDQIRKNWWRISYAEIFYIYTKIIVWCEDEERSIPLQVERKVEVNTQGKDQLLLLRISRRLTIFRQLTYQIGVILHDDI